MRQRILAVFIPCLLGAAALVLTPPAAAQTPPAESKPAAEAKPAEEAKPEAKAEAPAPADAPSAEKMMTGSVDIGYRWVGNVSGNAQTYRSVVNLGEGVRLLGADVSFTPEMKWLDRLDFRALGWGGDPYSTGHLEAYKEKAYRFTYDFRNIAYYDALPSFANPGLQRGSLLNQRSYDIFRRLHDMQLDLRPWGKWVPYAAFTNDGGNGTGVTVFQAEQNEYAVATNLRDQTRNLRGGVRYEGTDYHLTFEQGRLWFKDDQFVFTGDRNTGNRTTPFLGQTLFLQNLHQAYGIRGISDYTRFLGSANVVSWLDVSGQMLYSRPETDTSYAQASQGRFATLNPLGLVNLQQDRLLASARMPHTSANVSMELRPRRRIRVLESLLTDRYSNSATAMVAISPLMDRLKVNYQQQQAEVLVDVFSWLTLRGGHRYAWGDSQTRAGAIAGGATTGNLGSEEARLQRHSALAGAQLRLGQKFSLNTDGEIARGDRAYFRNSLLNYERFRFRARYALKPGLVFGFNVGFLNNENPAPGNNYEFSQKDFTASVMWMPKNGQNVRMMGEYGRAMIRSNMLYLAPSTLLPEQSFYRERAHTINSMLDLGMKAPGTRYAPRVSLGGSFFTSGGSRPSNFYQPVLRVAAPMAGHVDFTAEWRWYGLSQTFYAFEHFRGHQATIGLRLH